MILHVQLDGRERVLSLTDFEEQVIEGVVTAETPVRDGPDSPWRLAGTVPAFQAALHSPGARLRQRLAAPPVPWATALVAGIALRVHLWVPGTRWHEPLIDALARDPAWALERGQTWRYLTYAALHANLNHLVANLLLLVWCGVALETVVGSGATLALFAVSVVAGGLLGGLASPETPSIGASGADFGFLAACVVYGWRTRGLLPRGLGARFGGVLGALGLWSLLSSAFAEGVDNWAHLGGLLAGGAAMLLHRTADDAHNRRVAFGLGAGTAAVLVALALAGPSLVRLEVVAEDGVRAARPAAWTPGVTHDRELGWRSRAGAGAVAVSTRKHERAVDLDAAVADWKAAMEAVDPDDGIGFDQADWTTPDGLPARRLTATWTDRDGPGTTDAVLVARGRWVHAVTVDTRPDAARLRRRLVAEVLDRATFPLPDAWALAEAAGPVDSPRGRKARAEVLVDLGREAEALALYGDPATLDAAATLDWLEVQARRSAAALVEVAPAAVARHPDDRRLRLGAARLLRDADAVDPARALLTEGLARNPQDAALRRALERLGP